MAFLDETGLQRVWNKVKALIPTKTSELTNDSGFLTQHQDISGKQDKSTLESDVASKGFTKNTGTYSKPSGGIPKSDLNSDVQSSLIKADSALQAHQSLSGYATETWVENKGYLTQHQDISGKADKNYVDQALSDKVTEPSSDGTDGQVLATDGRGARYWKTVQGGGGGTTDYTDLTNKPQINGVTLSGNKTLAQIGAASASNLTSHTGNSNIHVTTSDKSTWNGKYSKPSGGIPSSDFAESVMVDVFNAIYPVGSIYMSVNSANPSTLFGGTWQRIKDAFLLGAGDTYSAGSTGGEATHTLTVDEMPAHTHTYTAAKSSQYISSSGSMYGVVIPNEQNSASAGGGQTHNNMPPYIAVYMWKRTA